MAAAWAFSRGHPALFTLAPVVVFEQIGLGPVLQGAADEPVLPRPRQTDKRRLGALPRGPARAPYLFHQISHAVEACEQLISLGPQPIGVSVHAFDDRLQLVQASELGAEPLVLPGQMFDLVVQHPEELEAFVDPARGVLSLRVHATRSACLSLASLCGADRAGRIAPLVALCIRAMPGGEGLAQEMAGIDASTGRAAGSSYRVVSSGRSWLSGLPVDGPQVCFEGQEIIRVA
jgi:hypothetical protein